ncbi:MAG: ATP-dependent RNA helicase DbpA [Pseudomonadota bacterium]
MSDSPPLSFTQLSLRPELADGVRRAGYEQMTPIQAHGLPTILAGRDLLAQARTGSGKTAAFALGILEKLTSEQYATQALVLCPTRELASQVADEFRRLAKAMANTRVVTLCGGKAMGPQLASLKRDPHIVVGTPGRIQKHLDLGTLELDALRTLVLDEADRMLDMGFHDDIMSIIERVPGKRQTLLFSATYPDGIAEISGAIQTNPVDLRVDHAPDTAAVEQVFYEVEKGRRTQTLLALLAHHDLSSCLVFCNRKSACQELADNLWERGFHALALHGDLQQAERDEVMLRFANNSCSILVATDVAARGIDIADLPAVVSFDLTPDPQVHVHRTGRTGRAGKDGLAINLFLPAERYRVDGLAEQLGLTVDVRQPPTNAAPGGKPARPPMVTLRIQGGRKDKLSAGDILGALTADKSVQGTQIGKINLFPRLAYVAVARPAARRALHILAQAPIKGRRFRVRRLR